MFPIVQTQKLAPYVHRFRTKAPMVAQKAQPGQFIILIVDKAGERVPFTISDWDRDAGTVDFVFVEVGRTTRQMAALKPGDKFLHFVGPLGRPAEIDYYGHVVVIASGFGIAAIVPVLVGLQEKGNTITTIVQASDRETVFGKDRLEALSNSIIMATGNQHGAATAVGALHQLLGRHSEKPIDRVVAMASMCVMRSVCEATRPKRIRTMVHLTPIMVDGTGMCGACRLSVNRSNRFACVHGPEFDGHEVDDWDVLLARRCTYADESTFEQGFQCRGCSQW